MLSSLLSLTLLLPARAADNHRLTAGIELFGLFLDGRQFEIGYERDRLRVAGAVASLSGDLWNEQSDQYSVLNDYAELTGSYYLFQPDARPGGFHAGLNATYYTNVAVTQLESGEQRDKSPLRVGGRIGYFYYPFRQYDFFVEPTFNLGVALNDADLTFSDGGVFAARGVQITGMIINIGGAFDLNRKKS